MPSTVTWQITAGFQITYEELKLGDKYATGQAVPSILDYL